MSYTAQANAEETREARIASCKKLLAQLDTSLSLAPEAWRKDSLEDSMFHLGAAKQKLLAELEELQPATKPAKVDKRTPMTKAADLEGYIGRERKRIEKREAEIEDLRGSLAEQLNDLETAAAELEEVTKPEFRKKMDELETLRAQTSKVPAGDSKTDEAPKRKAEKEKDRELALLRQIAADKDADGKQLTPESRQAILKEANELLSTSEEKDAKRRKGAPDGIGDGDDEDMAPLMPGAAASAS